MSSNDFQNYGLICDGQDVIEVRVLRVRLHHEKGMEYLVQEPTTGLTGYLPRDAFLSLFRRTCTSG